MKKNKLVSYCLFTYNQEEYIRESIEGALNQAYSPMEIIISDDCSSDRTVEVIEQTLENYSGPHKIIVNKNQQNLGIGGHFSKVCYTIAKGDYIIILGGDDISYKEHVEQAVSIIEENPTVTMIDFNAEIINKHGVFVKNNDLDFNFKKFTLDDYLDLRKLSHFAPGRILRKSLIDSFEPLLESCQTEDLVLVVRSLLMGGFIRVNKPLLKYRKHDASLSTVEGLSKFSNFTIIAQHLKDSIFLFDKGLIDEKTSIFLLKRISLELKLRDLKFSPSKNYVHAKCKLIYVDLLGYKFQVEKWLKNGGKR
ncbi:MAG: hypothetical protein DA407_07905 [Bacteroidetes bacterium]|nr:MAG: hypothetical protein DA407_07905 [Bacteroidota bacterium]